MIKLKVSDDIICLLVEKLGCAKIEAEKIVEKAVIGGEISEKVCIEDWVSKRLLPNTVLIDDNGYAMMCVDALKILARTAATDYGGSRQRDLGQLWADMTRGYLGEYAFKLYLKQKCNLDAHLGHQAGALKDFLSTDIHKVCAPGAEYRVPKINLSIKTTKWNGIWLDIPNDQFNHSEIHVLVKVGAGRDHLFAFFKKISVFKDKILKCGEDVGSLSPDESKVLYDELPSFKPIPAYICGFVRKGDEYKPLSYSGKKGRKNFKIYAWNGPINAGDITKIKEKENISGSVSFEGIVEFAHENGYLFNTGNLLWEQKDWEEVCRRL
ncbi:MAG: hypothetical protein ABII27_00060 [bacterium]